MKNITFPFKLAMLVLAIIVTASFHSCKRSFMYSDYTYELKAETKAPSAIYKNTPIPFELKLNGYDILDEEVKVKYLGSSLDGELRMGSQPVKIAAEFTHKFKTPLAFIFTPSVVGSGSLEFEVSFKGDVKKVSIPLTVSEAAYNFVVLNKRDTLSVGKSVDMQAKITENPEITKLFKTRSGDSKLTLTAVMGKGNGVLFFNNKPVFANALTKALPVSLLVAPEDLIDMKYSPLSHGENRIDVTIADEYSNSVIIPVSFKVDSTNFAATITSLVDSVELNKVLLFDLKVPIPGYTGALNVTPKLLSGAGRFAINGRNYATDTPFKLDKAGDYVLSFTPTSPDPVTLSLKIVDDYGQYAEVDLVCKVFVPRFYLQSNFDSSLPVKYKDHAIFTLSMTDALPTRYTCIATTTPLEALNSVLYIDEKQVPLNKVFTYDPKIKNIEFISSLCGIVTLKFELTKENGKSNYIDIPITVNPFALDFSIKNQSTTATKVNVPITFDLSMFEERYDTTYKIKVTQLQGEGALFFEGSDCTNLPKFLTQRRNGDTPLEYTPSTAGTHEIEFELTDHWGQVKTSRLTLATDHAPIIALPSVTALVTDVESPTTFTLTASEVGYTGDLFLSYSGGSGAVVTGATNNPLAVGQSCKIPNNKPISITYTPNATGDHVLEFTVMDIHGQKTNFTINVKSKNIPLTMTTAFQGAADGNNYLRTDVPISINVGGAFPITVTYATTGSGSVKRNGTTIQANTPIKLTAAEMWSFTPSVRSLGINTFNFTAKDRFNQEVTSSASIEIKYIPFAPAVNVVSSDTYINIKNQIVVSSDRYPVRLMNAREAQWTVYDFDRETSIDGITITAPTTFYFKPTDGQPGKVILKAYDSDNQEIEISTSIISPRSAALSSSFTTAPSSTLKGEPVTAKLTTSNTTSDERFTLASLRSTKKGAFNLNSGASISNSVSITFTPSEFGTHTITADVRDKHGFTKTAQWTLKVDPQAIEATCDQVGGTVGTDLDLTLRISKTGYSGSFNVFAIQNPSYPGTVTLPSGGVTGQGNYLFKYKPLHIQPHSIQLKVTDSEGQQALVTVSITPARQPFELFAPLTGESTRNSLNLKFSFKTAFTVIKVVGGADSGTTARVDGEFNKPLPWQATAYDGTGFLNLRFYPNPSTTAKATYDVYVEDTFGDIHVFGVKASCQNIGNGSYDTKATIKYFE